MAAPIEQQLSGLDGLLYYKSSNSSDGTMNLSVYFDISRDQDLAAVDVQNAVKLAEPQLPEEVRRNGITIRKANSDILLAGAITSDDPQYDAAYLSNYAKLYVEDELKRIPGVGNALIFGRSTSRCCLSLDPDKMAQLGITVGDVAGRGPGAEHHQPGRPAGPRAPSPETTQLTLPVTTRGRLMTPEEFGDVIVRAPTRMDRSCGCGTSPTCTWGRRTTMPLAASTASRLRSSWSTCVPGPTRST